MKNNLTFRSLTTDSPELDAAIKLYVDTFKTETMTSYNFNFDHPKTAKQYYQAVHLMAKATIVKGDDIIVAIFENKVVGVAIIAKDTKGSWPEMFNVLFPSIFKHLPLLTKINYRNLLTSNQAVKLSNPLNGNYVTLQVVAVSSNYQGKGFGKQIFQEIHDRYTDDYDGIYLYTADEKNKEIYKHFNYEEIEEISKGRLDVYHMVYKY